MTISHDFSCIGWHEIGNAFTGVSVTKLHYFTWKYLRFFIKAVGLALQENIELHSHHSHQIFVSLILNFYSKALLCIFAFKIFQGQVTEDKQNKVPT